MMWAQECPMSLREHLRVILDLFRIGNTILIIRLPLNVIDHWHEDDPVLKLVWLDVLFLQVLLNFLKNRQWWKSLEIFPLEFNCFFIDTNCILVWRIQNEFFHLTLPLFYCCWCPTERNQHRHVLLPLPIWSLDMNIPRISHTEFILNVLSPTFE